MECKQDENHARCVCTSDTCPRRGICCECLSTHLSKRSFPACVFPSGMADDRSFEAFARLVQAGKV